METLYGNLVRPYIESPEIFTLPGLILGIFFIHWLTSKRNIKHSLLEARIKAYKRFIAEYTVFFSGPSFARMDSEMNSVKSYIRKTDLSVPKINSELTRGQEEKPSIVKGNHTKILNNYSKNEIRILVTKEAFQVTKLFGECRLVAGDTLEGKLRDMYTIIHEELHSGEARSLSKEYTLLGYEIEQYMRYDLGAISRLSLFSWQTTFFWMRTCNKFLSIRETIKPKPKNN